MYADKLTDSMRKAIGETNRRRDNQIKYNKEHGITPQSIIKAIKTERLSGGKIEAEEIEKFDATIVPKEEISYVIASMQSQMDLAAKNLEFEKAAILRDQIMELKKEQKK
jgi:excinuclease ABC subunit B